MTEPKQRPKIYAIDFDNTIAETAWPTIVAPKLETISFIKRLQSRGDQWILWTNREGENLEAALAFLTEHGLRPDAVNDNLPQLKEFFRNNPRKVFANVYIDDRNAGGLKLED